MAVELNASQVTEIALAESLRLAVPLWIMELRQLDDETRSRRMAEWTQEAAYSVSCYGDILQFRTKAGKRHHQKCLDWWKAYRPGEHPSRPGDCSCKIGTAEVFNACARGIAALAHCPGGVTVFGLHWCLDHTACKRAAAEAQR